MQPTNQGKKSNRHIFKQIGFVPKLKTVLFFVSTLFIKTYPALKLVSSL